MYVVRREFTFIIEDLALGALTFTTFDRHITAKRFKCIDPEHMRKITIVRRYFLNFAHILGREL